MAVAESTRRHRHWIRFALGVILILAGVSALLLSPLRYQISFNSIVQAVESARQSGWSGLVFFCFFTIAVLALPITVFPIIGGVLFPFWAALPLNLLAATTGAYLAFILTRFFGRDAIETMLKGKLKMFDHLAAVEGFRTVLVLRLVGVPPFIVANYALGLSGIRTRDFLLGTALGIIPWMALITFTAHSLWEAILVGGEKGLSVALFKTMGPLMFLSSAVLVGAVIVYFVKQRRKKKAHSNL